MKKLIILALIALCSCRNKFEGDLLITKAYKPPDKTTNNYNRNYYVVIKTTNVDGNLCKYYLETESWSVFAWEVSFIDTIGKYRLSDKLYSNFEK